MKKIKSIIGIFLCACLLITLIPNINVQAKTKYKLNYTSKIMYEKDTFNLYPEYCFEKATYSSSNKKVATVNKKGIVKAKKVGKATITVKVGKQKMKCKITVKKMPTAKDISVTQYVKEQFGDTVRYLIIKNNSKETIKVSTNSKALDESGNVIGVDSGDVLAIGSKQTSVLVEYFSNTTNVSSFDTEYKVSISSYSDVLKNLQHQEDVLGNKVIITVDNKNPYKANFVQVYAFLFKDGQLVAVYSTYVEEPYSFGVNANESYTEQLDLYDEYDYIEFYYTGRG